MKSIESSTGCSMGAVASSRASPRLFTASKVWGSAMKVGYRLENRASRAVSCWFGVEFNFALLAGDAPDRYYWVDGATLKDRCLASTGETPRVRSFGLKDEFLGLEISLNLDRPATLWRFPIETVSRSEGGFERVYQSSVVFPNWKLELGPGEAVCR